VTPGSSRAAFGLTGVAVDSAGARMGGLRIRNLALEEAQALVARLRSAKARAATTAIGSTRLPSPTAG
jgi:hypothetical protein